MCQCVVCGICVFAHRQQRFATVEVERGQYPSASLALRSSIASNRLGDVIDLGRTHLARVRPLDGCISEVLPRVNDPVRVLILSLRGSPPTSVRARISDQPSGELEALARTTFIVWRCSQVARFVNC